MFGVPGRVNQSERAAAGPSPELREARALATKLLDVAATKLLEATRLVREPLPKLRARREFSVPFIEPCPLTRHPARGSDLDGGSGAGTESSETGTSRAARARAAPFADRC